MLLEPDQILTEAVVETVIQVLVSLINLYVIQFINEFFISSRYV